MLSVLNVRGINLLFFSLCSLFCILIFSNCASVPNHENTLALVDGEPVTRDDLGYSLQIAHRRENLSITKKFDISEYIQKLIDDRLIIQEARRMGLEDSPDIQEKIRDFVLRESVVRLYNEEIVGKVSVTEEDIKDQRIKELSEKYLVQLREKAAVKIDRELLASIKLDDGDITREEWSKDKRPLVQANNMTLTVGDFAAMLPEKLIQSKEEILNNRIDVKLVDLDALSRHYDVNTDLKDMVQRYKNVLLKAAFTRRVINPGIKMTNKDAEDYYMSHQEVYVKPVKYKLQQITLNSREDAQEVLNSLSGGANFSWLAKAKSKDSFASTGGVMEWKTKELFPDPVREIIDDLKQGDISQILQIDSQYLIFRLIEKSGREVEVFSNVKAIAYKAAYEKKFHELYDTYIDKLRKDARIELNDEAIRAYEKTFKK